MFPQFLPQFRASTLGINLVPPALVLGLINHLYFHRFEPKSADIPILVLTIEPLLLLVVFSVPFSLIQVLKAYFVFLSSLCLSIIIYRISPWHPLSDIPGPTLNKITQLRSIWSSRAGDQHRVNKRLHDTYGPFVRTGPNEISIIHVDAVKGVLGSGGFPKGQWYEARTDPSLPTRSLLALRGEAHANRRRIWNRCMSSESLLNYGPILANRVAQLASRLEGLSGSVDMSEWIGFFTFDFMGDLAFGGGFEMLRNGGDKDGLRTILKDGQKSLGIVSRIPWAYPTLMHFPMVSKGMQRLRRLGVECATNRIKAGSQIKDLWYHLTDEAGAEKVKPTMAEAKADGVMSIIAGADTTSTALCGLLFFLLSHPEIYARVQVEVGSVYADGEHLFDTSKHADLPLLTACINETLRLQPPVRTNGTRQVASGGGKVVAGRYVPEGTHIYVPPYSLHRSADHFRPAPDKFDPDRWLRTPSPDAVLNTSAFIPFSYGAANCVGKALAWQEMLMVTSVLVKKFNMRFADDFESADWMDCMHDYFVTIIGRPLLVVLSPR